MMGSAMAGIVAAGTAAAQYQAAMADGKGTLNELVHAGGATAQSFLATSGMSQKVVLTVPDEVDCDGAGQRVAEVLKRAFADRRLTASETAQLVETMAIEAFSAAGIGDTAIVTEGA